MAKINISLDLLAELPNLLTSKSYILYEYNSENGVVHYSGKPKRDIAKITFDKVYMNIEIPDWDYPLDLFGIRPEEEEEAKGTEEILND